MPIHLVFNVLLNIALFETISQMFSYTKIHLRNLLLRSTFKGLLNWLLFQTAFKENFRKLFIQNINPTQGCILSPYLNSIVDITSI